MLDSLLHYNKKTRHSCKYIREWCIFFRKNFIERWKKKHITSQKSSSTCTFDILVLITSPSSYIQPLEIFPLYRENIFPHPGPRVKKGKGNYYPLRKVFCFSYSISTLVAYQIIHPTSRSFPWEKSDAKKMKCPQHHHMFHALWLF